MLYPVRLLVLIVCVLCSSVSNSAETLTFGVVPQQAASTLARLWTPILQAVSKAAGENLVFATA